MVTVKSFCLAFIRGDVRCAISCAARLANLPSFWYDVRTL
jgi:hypothetical protein